MNLVQSLFSWLTSKEFVLRVTESCLALTSIACTILLLTSLTSDPISMAIAAVTGLGLQLSMYVLPIYASDFWSGRCAGSEPRRFVSTLCWLGSFVLLGVSVVASTTFLDTNIRETKEKVNNVQLATSSTNSLIEAKQAQLVSIQNNIDNMSALANKYAQGTYGTRATELFDKVAELNKTYDSVYEDVNRLMALSQKGSEEKAQESLPWYYQTDTGRLWFFGIISVLIDGMGIWVILLLQEEKARKEIGSFIYNSSDRFSSTDIPSDRDSRKSDVMDASDDFMLVNEEPISSGVDESWSADSGEDGLVLQSNPVSDFSENQDRAYKRLLNRVDVKPVLKQIREGFNLSRAEARVVFDRLESEGQIRPTSDHRKSYEYC